MSQSPDDYEKRYMRSEGKVLFRDRVMAPRFFHGLMLATMGIIIGVSSYAGLVTGDVAALLGPLATLPVLGLAWVMNMALRTMVSTTHVHIQYGVFGPKIPIAAIEACRIVEYSWAKYGGWGIRRGLDGSWAYNMMGDKGRAAEIVYSSGGKRRKVLVSVKDLAGFVDAVEKARATTTDLAAAREAQGLLDAPAVDSLEVHRQDAVVTDPARARR